MTNTEYQTEINASYKISNSVAILLFTISLNLNLTSIQSELPSPMR